MRIYLLVLFILGVHSDAFGQESAQSTKTQLPAILKATAIPNENARTEFEKLLIGRHNAVIEEIAVYNDRIQSASGDLLTHLFALVDASERYVKSGIEMTQSKERKEKLFRDRLELLKHIEGVVKARSAIGVAPEAFPRIRYHIFDCEIAIQKLHGEHNDSVGRTTP